MTITYINITATPSIANSDVENAHLATVSKSNLLCKTMKILHLVQNGYTLRKYGIDFQYKRTRNGRLINLHYDHERDSSDSKNSTVVTVNGAHKQYLANP